VEIARDSVLGKKKDRKESNRRYYLRHVSDIREAKRDYYSRNKDNIKDYYRKYVDENKHSIRESYRKYYLRNQDYKRISSQNYHANNRNKIKETKREYYVRKKENPALYVPRETEFKSWKTPLVVREYFESISKLLHIVHYTDWYRISRPQVRFLGGVCFVSNIKKKELISKLKFSRSMISLLIL
jgi:hypothetical protein